MNPSYEWTQADAEEYDSNASPEEQLESAVWSAYQKRLQEHGLHSSYCPCPECQGLCEGDVVAFVPSVTVDDIPDDEFVEVPGYLDPVEGYVPRYERARDWDPEVQDWIYRDPQPEASEEPAAEVLCQLSNTEVSLLCVAVEAMLVADPQPAAEQAERERLAERLAQLWAEIGHRGASSVHVVF